MKRTVAILATFLSALIFASFLEDMQSIDREIQSKNYAKALEKSENLLKTNLSEDEKKSLLTIIKEIKSKKDDNTAVNNLGLSNSLTLTDDTLASSGDGTLPTLVNEEISDGSKFSKYSEYEKQILSTSNSDAINQLALLYIRENLYESAMKLAMKDKNKDPRNMYLAATAARMIGKYDTAIDLYSKVLSKNSGHSKSILGLAMAYKGKGQYKQALKYLRQYSNYDSSDRIVNEIQVLESL